MGDQVEQYIENLGFDVLKRALPTQLSPFSVDFAVRERKNHCPLPNGVRSASANARNCISPKFQDFSSKNPGCLKDVRRLHPSLSRRLRQHGAREMEDDKDQSVSRRTCLAAAIPAVALGVTTPAFSEEAGGRLFAAIRRGKVKPGAGEEFAKRVKAGALPVMKRMDGFRAYYLVVSPDDTVMALSVFANKAVAETSTQTLLPWIKENLGPLLASPTEAIDGEVLVIGSV
jgi:hypothetical protein